MPGPSASSGIDGVRFAVRSFQEKSNKDLKVDVSAIEAYLAGTTSASGLVALIRLCSVLLTTAVTTAEVAERYTGAIMGLAEDYQTCLMELVENMIPELSDASAEEEQDEGEDAVAASSTVTPGRSSRSAFSSASILKSASRTGNKRKVNFADGADVATLASSSSPVGKFAAKAIGSASKMPHLAAVAAEVAAIDQLRRGGKMLVAGTGASAIDADEAKEGEQGEEEEGDEASRLLREELEDLRDALSAAKREITVLKSSAAAAAAAAEVGSSGSSMRTSVAGGGAGIGRFSLSSAGDSASSQQQQLARLEQEMEARRQASENEAALKQQLKDAETSAKTLAAKVTKLTQELDGLKGLREEVDVLRPQAAARERAEANVEKLKKKVRLLLCASIALRLACISAGPVLSCFPSSSSRSPPFAFLCPVDRFVCFRAARGDGRDQGLAEARRDSQRGAPL